MKNSKNTAARRKSLTRISFFLLALVASLVLLTLLPSRAQNLSARQARAGVANAAATVATSTDVVTTAATSARPPSMQQHVSVMVELNDAPAAVTWAAQLQQAQAQADAARNYALQHPTLKSSKAILNGTPKQVRVSSAGAQQVQSVAQKLDQAQRSLLSSLTGPGIAGKVLFRAQLSYNGIAMVVSPDKIAAIAALPGVKAVHPMNPKYPAAAFSDIDFLGTRPLWTKTPFTGNLGDGVVVADIDTGLDYYHADFGGNGIYPMSAHTGAFPGTPKAPIGYDFAGDNYSAGVNDNTAPDPDPFDCGGHGTATASLIAGTGVTNSGNAYVGSYNASVPDMTQMKCAPGLAPHALLCPLRVFGCSGSTNLVTEAIEWVMAYNMNMSVAGYPAGTHNPSYIHVISMSLGANEGYADDADDVAASNAASTGIIICSAAGNAGDSYYIHSSPAAASGTLGVAATYNNQNGYIYNANVTASAPVSINGSKYYAIIGSASSAVPGGGITGNVVYAVPPDASTALTNAAQVSGNICLVNRGTVTFTAKVTAALNAGATAVIIDNYTQPGLPPIVMSTAGQPAGADVMISRTDRDTIVTAAGGDPTQATGYNSGAMTGFNPTTGVPTTPVTVTINNDNGAITSAANPPGTAAGTGSTDTIPSYSSRGPRLPDSAIKPDIAAPAEVTGVASPFTGNGIENFNGTSSATPHVAGEMALLRQLHPTWSVQELNALACDTATHDLFTTEPGPSPSPTPGAQYGVGRIGAGRIDLTNAANANVVAFNGTDPNLIGVSFGVVEAPVDGVKTLTKNITVENKGTTNVTYNVTIQNNPAVTGATFAPGTPSFTVNAGTTMTIPVTFTATGSQLKHVRETSVASTQSGNSRQWLTEAGGYAVFTPTDSSPTLRVELYAAPKPVSSLHSTSTSIVPTTANTGSFTINLSGSGVNTGSSYGNGFDILSLVKAFELQYQSEFVGLTNPPTDRNVIKFAGVTSDYLNRASGTAKASTNIMFGVEKFGDAATPDYASSDTEIYFDTNPADVGGTFNPNYVAYLTNAGTGLENVFVPVILNLNTFAGATRYFTNGFSAASYDTNIYNNSGIVFPIRCTDIGLVGSGGTGNTQFQYLVVTYDRNGNEVDQSNVLFYDLANPGLYAPLGNEPTYAIDSASNFINVNYNGTNYGNAGSLGLWLLHMHNGDGNRSDVITFLPPTITGFSPGDAPIGAFVTLTGTNYGPGTQVFFQGPSFSSVQATAVNVITSTTISVQVPSGAVSGFIRVQNAAGSNAIGGFAIP